MSGKFSAGDEAWLPDGRKVYVTGTIVEGGYVVQPAIDTDFHDPEYGPPPSSYGAPEIAATAYPQPPVFVFDAELEKTRQALATARQQVEDIRGEVRAATAERTRVLEKLKQVPALAYIEQFLDGKMGWIAITDYGCGYKVMPMADAIKLEDRWRDKETKLLSLFGDAKGDLHWRLSTYHDGSGSKIELWPFETEEAAKAFALQRLLHDVEEAFAMFLGDGRYASHLATRAKWLTDAGGTITAGAQEVIDRAKRESLESARANAVQYAAQYNDKIAGIDAELAKLGGGAP